LLGADYRLTDNWPVPYRCISKLHDPFFVKTTLLTLQI